jgi:hypothetical protein
VCVCVCVYFYGGGLFLKVEVSSPVTRFWIDVEIHPRDEKRHEWPKHIPQSSSVHSSLLVAIAKRRDPVIFNPRTLRQPKTKISVVV